MPAARNQVFNIGTDVPCTINDMAIVVAEAMEAKADIVHLDPRNEVKIAFSDHSKAERDIRKATSNYLSGGSTGHG